MNAITTKYLGPTNFKGSRIKAKWESKSYTVAWDYELDSLNNHMKAAAILAYALELKAEWVGAPTDTGWVFAPKYEAHTFTIE